MLRLYKLLKIMMLMIFIASFLSLYTFAEENSAGSLKLAHVVFRHGRRTGSIKTALQHVSNPDVLNINYSLTAEGETDALILGKWLHNRYGDFLGPSYSSEVVEGGSTIFYRSIETLDMVLRGLFPSNNSHEDVNSKYNQSKFVLTILPLNSTLILMPNPACVHFNKLYNEYMNTEDGIKVLTQFTRLNHYVEANINKTFTTIGEFLFLFHAIVAEKENGASIPEWMEKLVHEIDLHMVDFFACTIATKELKQIVLGSFAKKVIETSELKFKNQLQPKKRKMFLYSVHGMNMYYVLTLFKYLTNIKPHYNSCIMIEAHTINNKDGIKVFYKPGSDDTVRAVNIPNCGFFCPLSKFSELIVAEYFPPFDTC